LIEVTRRPSSFAVFRKLKIEIDGVLVLELPRSSSASAHVEPGRHEVVAGMDWERSLPLEVTCTDEESTKLEVVAVAPFRALFAMLSGKKLIEVRPHPGETGKGDPSN
jgi:hypothetical protein